MIFPSEHPDDLTEKDVGICLRCDGSGYEAVAEVRQKAAYKIPLPQGGYAYYDASGKGMEIKCRTL